MFDPNIPAALKDIQIWFGGIIGRPIDRESRMLPISPSGRPMEEESADYIRPSKSLSPKQRILIYNQQYWWRLLNALQETFPLVTRLFGYHDFNFKIATPYLLAYPPRDWSLTTLGDRLFQWVEENYTANDKKLILNAVWIDSVFSQSFTAKQCSPLVSNAIENQNDLNALLDSCLYLQPHLHLIQLPYDLLSFRLIFLKESPDFWLENDFPEIAKEKNYQFVIFRDFNNDIGWNEISTAEYALLKFFQKGSSINQACEWLENQEEALVEEASQNLHRWLKEWVIRKWLTLNP